MSYAEHLVGKYVIPKKKVWDSSIPTFPLVTENSVNERTPGEKHIFIEDIPIWYVVSAVPNKKVIVQTTYFMPRRKRGDYVGVNADDLTEFLVTLKEDAPTDGALQDPSQRRVGVVVGTTEEHEAADDMIYYVKDKLSEKG